MAELDDAAAFAARRTATPLVDASALARRLGLAHIFLKDETARWGLNAFKTIGVSYALARVLGQDGSRPPALTCASAGNHGRAVAHAARERGLPCRVFLPADAYPARVAAIRAEAADVPTPEGTYEDAVARAAAFARDTGAMLISDTTPPGDPRIPALIITGYTALFSEAALQWPAPPDVVVTQAGVGGLAGAAAGWMTAHLPTAQLVVAEAEGSACLAASAEAGRLVSLDSTPPTSMVCLRCATPNEAAWPHIASRTDAFVTVSDALSAEAVETLRAVGIEAGASGACGLAALLAAAPTLQGRTALVVVTEGRT